jgi:predicted ester cyclase
MELQKKNKEFIIRYFNAINGVPKTRELLEKFISDEILIEHIIFFEAAFPKYELYAEELTAEGNRVVVLARKKARHTGELNGIPPTFREVELPLAISYEIENEKIIRHWLIADQMLLMEQLGVTGVAQE